MAKLVEQHWTERSVEDYLYRVGADYIRQIQGAMDIEHTAQSELAAELGVSKGRVSQVMNNPGNLTLKNVIQYARALGKKVSIVMYSDDDIENSGGPINSQIFERCWELVGKPSDFIELAKRETSNRVASVDISTLGVEATNSREEFASTPNSNSGSEAGVSING
jgi:transcriptional regulator with XRE-family HTH domain